jgi:hypothetical protein
MILCISSCLLVGFVCPTRRSMNDFVYFKLASLLASFARPGAA